MEKIDVCKGCKMLNRCVKVYAVAGYPPCARKTKESRPTVRAKRPVQQLKFAMCPFCKGKISVSHGTFFFHNYGDNECPGSGARANV